MKFISTRGKSPAVTAAEAIRRGLAPDGGLYVPDELPVFSASELEALYALPYAELSAAVLERFLPGFSREELLDYTKKAYPSFDDDAVVPLHALGDKLWTMELFHGPTCAFKDVALQILPYLLAASVRKCADDHTVAILVATSGDTGKAALEGFADVPGTKIAVFYPDGGVSDIQRAQMATQGGNNVLVLAVRGNFDDAQTGVKDIFADAALASELDRAGVVLSSANSINWGRLAPQIAYYFAAYAQLLRAGAVATGCGLTITNLPGNLPIIPVKDASVIEEALSHVCGDTPITCTGPEFHSTSSGDYGDVSCLMPLLQFNTGGFRGALHTPDVELDDIDDAYVIPAKVFALTAYKLLKNGGDRAKAIIESFEALLTKEQYIDLMESMLSVENIPMEPLPLLDEESKVV